MRGKVKSLLSILLRPYASSVPLDKWNYWLGRIYDVKLLGRVKAFKEETTGCSANINIVMHLLNQTRELSGDVAECGVFKGATLVAIVNELNALGDKRNIYGFDSFEGFGDAAKVESDQDSSGHINLESEMFKNTSVDLIRQKLKLTQTSTERLFLVKGYFEDSLPAFEDHAYSFVHLDCDLASSYSTCLDFFYPRMQKNGCILFDEYIDPVYTQAKEAIDRFFEGKPEVPVKIVRDNYVKYYIKKV